MRTKSVRGETVLLGNHVSYNMLLAGAALVVIVPVAAWAQDVPEGAAAQGGGAEIVVTAQKRSQLMKDIPISINAFSGDRLKESGVKSFEDVQFLAAGLQLGHDRTGEVRVSIRGVSSNVGLESAVAVHQDGIYLSQRFDQARAYFDIARIEVLRGPQGTLYGRNATGGAVNIITNEPTAQMEGGAQLTLGNYGLVEGEGFVSGPLVGDSVKARLAFKTSDLPGYGRNLYNGERSNGEDSTAVRAKIAIEASSALSIHLSGDYAVTNSSYDDEIRRLFPDTPLATEADGYVPPRYFDSNTNYPDFQHIKAWGVGLRGDLDLGFASLSSISGYRKLRRTAGIDIDGSPQARASFRSLIIENKQFSQEFNLTSQADGALDWLVGVYYYHNDYSTYRHVDLDLVGSSITASVPKYINNSYATFGEISYKFADFIKLTAGARYSVERQHFNETRQIGAGAVGEISNYDNWESFTPKIALNVDLSRRISLYGTVSKGFKSGGFNVGTFVAQSFNPEKVTNYEVGLKGSAFDGMLGGSIAAFYMDYSDLQVPTYIIVDGVPAQRIVNAAKATIKGIEADFVLEPASMVSLDGNLSYLNAKYDRFLAADNIIGSNRDVSGNKMFGVPSFSANLGANVTVPVAGEWSAKLRGEWSYQGKTYFTPFEDLRGVSQKSYSLFNARLELHNPDQGWRVAAYIRNITNKRVAGFMNELVDTPYTGVFRATTYKPPRTFGVSVGVDFK